MSHAVTSRSREWRLAGLPHAAACQPVRSMCRFGWAVDHLCLLKTHGLSDQLSEKKPIKKPLALF